MDEHLAQSIQRISDAFAAKRFADAEQLATEAISAWSFDGRLRGLAAISAFSASAFSRSLTHAMAAAEREPWLLRQWHLVGASLSALRRDADARCVYERMLALWPGDERAERSVRNLGRGNSSAPIRALVERMRARPTLSACLIVKDEAARLGRCLASLRGVHDELIVVDTGSRDETVAIAKSHGARVLAFPWCDDFSAARNYAVDAATGDWILSIDADEQLAESSRPALAAILMQQTAGAVSVELDELLDGDGRYLERMVRVFRRHPLVRFEGRIHEQITPSLARCGFTAVDSDVTIRHDGYRREVIAETGKLDRNERLLLAEIARAPDDAYWRYQLGKNQMMQHSYPDAIASFGEALARLSASNAQPAPFVLDLYCCCLRLLVATRDTSRALSVAEDAITLFPSAPDLRFFYGQALLELGRRVDAHAAFTHVVRDAALCRDPALPAIAREIESALQSEARAGAPLLVQNDFIAVTEARHGTFMFNRNDAFIGRALELYGEWCEAELELLLPQLKPGMWALDVGANIGTHTVALAKAVGTSGHVVAFEPQAFTHMLLSGNVALNALTNVTALRAAAGDGTQPLRIPSLDPREQRNFGAVAVGGAGDYVDQVRIDDLALQQCHLIKIDVEGAEAAVLRGAAETITRTKPVLFIENNTLERSAELLELVARFGYRAYWHLASYYRPDNFRGNADNVFQRYQPEANILAVARHVEVAGLIEVAGVDDDWQRALQRIVAHTRSRPETPAI